MGETTSEEKNRLIVEAATKRFAYYGFTKVTMDEIAADVGMGKASLYYYFATKEKLFQAVIESEREEFVTKIEALINKNSSSAQKLKEYVKLRLESFRDLVNIGSITLKQSSEANAIFRTLLKSFMEREKKLLETILNEGKRNNEFSISTITATAELFLHILQGMRLRTINEAPHRIEEEQFQSLQKEMELFVSIFIKGIQK
ncbi:MAG: TetR/AcrR family transcriptional regulator [Bacteroidetes bacterium]|nr:TetR/AcrR family transcriptional regulator [Bacteroidota bacterium]